MNTIPRVLLNTDSFIFACHSADTARHKRDGSFNSHLRFDPFLMNSFRLPSNPGVKQLAGLARDILKHHFQVSPQFRRNEDIDLETISYFTMAITTIFADLETLFKNFTGMGLPRIPQNPPEYDTDYPLLQKAIAKFQAWVSDTSDEKGGFELYPLDSLDADLEAAALEQDVLSCEIWDIISETLNPVFPEHGDAILSYAFWKYQPQSEAEPIDWRVRPPVGELFAKHFRLPSGARRSRDDKRGGGRDDKRGGGRDDKRGGGRGGDRGGERSGPPADKPFKKSEGLPAADFAEKPFKKSALKSEHSDEAGGESRPERAERGGASRSERSGERPKSDAGRTDRPRGDAPATGADELEVSLQEARDAMEQLNKNPKLQEVALAPSNSYVRRQQHSLIVELGYETESRGEGRSRAVYVRRKTGE